MENQRRKMIPGLVIFGVIVLLLAGSLALPKEEILPIENRKAAALPAFSMEDWVTDDYPERLQSYVDDRVALRQTWISAKCFVDEMLLGMTEESGILLGKDGQMFTGTFESAGENEQFAKNVAALSTFAETSEVPVTVMIIPSPATILSDRLPANAPMASEAAMLEELKSELAPQCTVLEERGTLEAHRDEYIFYRTDHHWTTLGAYYAYADFCEAKGMKPCEPDWEQAVSVPDFYGTHYAKTRYALTKPDTICYFPVEESMTVYRVTGDAAFEANEEQAVINEEQFEKYDKYAAFLDGNNGYSTIPGEGKGRILVVKDSYANCFVPFLLANYEQVGVVDYRNYAYNLPNLVEKEDYDEVLFLYSMQGFAADTGLAAINRPVLD